MGLYAEFHIDDYDYPDELTAIGGGGGEEGGIEVSVEVDYSYAIQACMDTFMDIATKLVPIDTGYLHDSIDVEDLGDGVAFYAEAEYAQYVEFGTSRMSAQEYFRPALEEAMAIFHQEAQIAQDWAEEQLQNIVGGLMDASMAFSESMGMGFMGGLATFAVVSFLLFPVLLFTYGVLDALGDAFFGDSQRLSFGDGIPEIIIT